jgi:phage FluMu gp28-like protein
VLSPPSSLILHSVRELISMGMMLQVDLSVYAVCADDKRESVLRLSIRQIRYTTRSHIVGFDSPMTSAALFTD